MSADSYSLAQEPSDISSLLAEIKICKARVGVIGLGYVGLPLVEAIVAAGFDVLGVEIDDGKIKALNNKTSYIKQIPDTIIAGMVDSGQFEATSDFSRVAECDVLLICVPTPLTRYREPDLSFVENTCKAAAPIYAWVNLWSSKARPIPAPRKK